MVGFIKSTALSLLSASLLAAASPSSASDLLIARAPVARGAAGGGATLVSALNGVPRARRAYVKPKPNLARWAEFTTSSSIYSGRRARRAAAPGDATPAAEGNPDLIGAPQPRYSPLPPINGETITQTMAQQIKNDVNAVIGQFAGLPTDIQNVLKTAISQIMNQQIYTSDPQRQYDIVSNSILDQLNAIEDSLPNTLLNLQAPLDDTADFYTLRNCVMNIVAMGGITSEDQGSCLTNSGYSLDSLKKQFNQFVDMNTFVIPANAVNDAVKEINKYLSEQPLVPYLKYLIGNATNSLQNVALTVAAKERDATQTAFECWLEAIQVINEKSLAERNMLCNTGNGKGVTKGTTLQNLQEAFQSRANQYMGALPPMLAYNVQRIGMTTLTLQTGSYDSNVRDAINDAIHSAVSATSGESATVVGHMIDCINTMYDADTTKTCNPNSDEDVLNHNKNIYFNYLSQFASILPKKLVEKLNATVQNELGSDTGVDAAELRQQIEDLFQQASLGTLYTDCQIEFTNCVVKAMHDGTVTTPCTDKKGAACQSVPPLVPGSINSSDPYGEIAAGLQGDGKWGGLKHKRFQRAVRKLATDHINAAKRGQNPVRRSGIELLSEADL